MTKEDLLEVDGVMTAFLPNLMARPLEYRQEILAMTCRACGVGASGFW
jgi:hypothetical protein